MALPGVWVSGLRAALDETALRDRRLALTVESGILRFSVQGLRGLIPASVPIRVEHLDRGRGFLRASVLGLEPLVEVRPEVAHGTRVRFVPVAVRAGFLPLPGSVLDAVLGLARSRFPDRPGLHLGQHNQVEIDLGEILARAGIRLPPIRGLRAENGVLEIHF